MDHDHHEDRNAYYIEQLCTIAICGGIGGVAVMLYLRGLLGIFLAPQFHLPVLGGGIALLLLVAIRAVVIWQAVEVPQHHHDHDHAHDHAHCHDHDHAECHEHEHSHAEEHHHEHARSDAPGHSHGHDHDHAWNPWRYAVLLLPIVLYFMNLPNQGFSSDWIKSRGLNMENLENAAAGNFSPDVGIQFASAGEQPRVEKVGDKTPAAAKGIQPGDLVTQITRPVDAEGKALATPDVVATKGLSMEAVLEKLQGRPGTKVVLTIQRAGQAQPLEVELVRDEVITLEFKELERAKFSPEARDYYSGRKGKLRGQFSPSSRDKFFTLMRLRMTCCGADVQAINVAIEAPESLTQYQAAEWIEVEGQIQFLLDSRRNVYVPKLQVTSMDKIRKIPPEPNLYVQW